MKTLAPFLLAAVLASGGIRADDLATAFINPPAAARPGSYWYFMDGNLSREGMTRDLESMKKAGLGHVIFLEVNVGVPRGTVDFLSDQWQDLFAHAVREAERLGLEVTLGSGPGWAGSGGPWVKPEQSMQHLVASKVEVQGPGRFPGQLPAAAPPHRPFFGEVPPQMKERWAAWYADIAVLAFPTPPVAATIPDIDEKSLVYRAPFSSQPGVKARLEAPAEFPSDKPGSVIPTDKLTDLTDRLRPDGTLDWDIPEGKWTVLRFVSRNNGASTRPAPEPGIGFECDKFDAAALDAHYNQYVGQLLKRVGPRQPGKGWTMLHIDSWEMGAQNWTAQLRQEFLKRRGYDPQPYYPVYAGLIVGNRELSERFLWDLRLTGQELVIENHAAHLKRLGRKDGFQLSIEPYDMTPVNDFDLGRVADMPMCEFWSVGFDTDFSCAEASSVAHVLGRPVVGAEAFTANHTEAWRFYPGHLKNQGDWAFAAGINRLTYHTFAHKPDEGRPGMVMGPYGVHWDRGQTWWPMVDEYHRYISRCSHLLRQGRTVADVLYLMPEGAPNVFQPPPSAFTGSPRMPDRRGYNFDGCSALTLIDLAKARDGKVVFPSGAEYRLLVLPDCDTMTPELLEKIAGLVQTGASVAGNPPVKSPSLVDYPRCDHKVAAQAVKLWGGLHPPSGRESRSFGKGRVVWGEGLKTTATIEPASIFNAKWIWEAKGNPVIAAPLDSVRFERQFTIEPGQHIASAKLAMTADNSFEATLNGTSVLAGNNFHQIVSTDIAKSLRPGTNTLTVLVANAGDAPNPAGLLGMVEVKFRDGSLLEMTTDEQWLAVVDEPKAALRGAQVLGPAQMGPWNLTPATPKASLYPPYEFTSALLKEMNLPEDFTADEPIRHTHRRTAGRDVYFVANRSAESLEATAAFRVASGAPELWHPQQGAIRALPKHTRRGQVTEVPLKFEPYESYFIVFPAKRGAAVAAPVEAANANFPLERELRTLGGAWEVAFDPGMGAPPRARFDHLEDWSKSSDPGIRYYSGIATYRQTFDRPAAFDQARSSQVWLDLGVVQVMARVRVNGRDCGVAWTAPWRVDITQALKPRGNLLEIEVANLWPNRMIGDAASPDKKYTQTTYRPYKASDPLLPSGLIGPVRILSASFAAEK